MDEYLKVEDMMGILGISRTTAYGIIHAGRLWSFKVGRLLRIKGDDLRRFIEESPQCRSLGGVDGKEEE